MKNIAVLTDFSEASEHAALYALHLAKKINANVILHHFSRLQVTRQIQVVDGFTGDEDEESRMISLSANYKWIPLLINFPTSFPAVSNKGLP